MDEEKQSFLSTDAPVLDREPEDSGPREGAEQCGGEWNGPWPKVSFLLRKPASWLVAVCERSENRGLGGLVDSEDQNLAVRL